MKGHPRGVSDVSNGNPSSRHIGGQEGFDDHVPCCVPWAQRPVLEIPTRSGVCCPMELGFEESQKRKSLGGNEVQGSSMRIRKWEEAGGCLEAGVSEERVRGAKSSSWKGQRDD